MSLPESKECIKGRRRRRSDLLLSLLLKADVEQWKLAPVECALPVIPL